MKTTIPFSQVALIFLSTQNSLGRKGFAHSVGPDNGSSLSVKKYMEMEIKALGYSLVFKMQEKARPAHSKTPFNK